MADFDTIISSPGNISLDAGTAKHFFFKINGSGSVKAFNMIAENPDVTTNGSGSTEIIATERLKLRIKCSSNVYYKG